MEGIANPAAGRSRADGALLRGDFDLARSADGRINVGALIQAVKT